MPHYRQSKLKKTGMIASATSIGIILGIILGMVVGIQKNVKAQSVTAIEPTSQALLEFINGWRVKAGRPALTWLPIIDQAALAHSVYLWEAHQGAISHHQTKRNSQYFRGQNPSDRVKLLYPQAENVGEVLGNDSGGNAFEVIQELFDAPFHRVGLLGNFKYAGAGSAWQPPYQMSVTAKTNGDPRGVITTINMVDQPETSPAAKFIVWPFAGQEEVKIDWYDYESPSPLPDQYFGRLVGYPISLQSPKFDQKLRDIVFTVTDSNGTVTTSTNPSHGFLNYSNEINGSYKDRDYAIFVPFRPWARNMVYTVKASGLINAVPFNASWQFSTTGSLPLTASIVPKPRGNSIDQNVTFEITLSGGTGNYRGANGRTINYSTTMASDQQGKPIIPKRINDRVWRFQNQCNSIRPCKVSITFYDSASMVTVPLELLGQ